MGSVGNVSLLQEKVMETRNGNESNSDCDGGSEISGLSDLGMEGRWNSSAGNNLLVVSCLLK